MNQVCIVGRLTRTPELRMTQSGTSVCTFTVAVNRYVKDGESAADFIDCVAWQRTAENLAKYMSKGKMVGVTGRIQTRAYETKDGQRRKATEVVASHVLFLSPKDEHTDEEEYEE